MHAAALRTDCDKIPQRRRLPVKGIQMTDCWEYQTDKGTVIFRPVEDLFPPMFALLKDGDRPAWELEDSLAAEFQITARERSAVLSNGHRAWENHVAWALSQLRRRKSISKLRVEAAPGGGRRGIYRLNK
jgi:Mrr restriction endonuclease-like protein